MDMNFPHKSLARTDSETDADLICDLDSLVAFAVERQSESVSSRAFAALQLGEAQEPMPVQYGPREDRIKFFAGDINRTKASVNGERIFTSGHFRPDLVRENPAR